MANYIFWEFLAFWPFYYLEYSYEIYFYKKTMHIQRQLSCSYFMSFLLDQLNTSFFIEMCAFLIMSIQLQCILLFQYRNFEQAVYYTKCHLFQEEIRNRFEAIYAFPLFVRHKTLFFACSEPLLSSSTLIFSFHLFACHCRFEPYKNGIFLSCFICCCNNWE